MERAKGFEPSTATLARWSSTTELRSLSKKRTVIYRMRRAMQSLFPDFLRRKHPWPPLSALPQNSTIVDPLKRDHLANGFSPK
jgi:hypothetical protein